MGVLDNLWWSREPVEELESEKDSLLAEDDYSYQDSLDDLRQALGYRDQLLMEQDERIASLEREVDYLQEELSENEVALAIAQAESDHRAKKLEDAKSWANEADKTFNEQKSIIENQRAEIVSGKRVIDELSVQVDRAEAQSRRWKESAEREKDRAGKLSEIVVELVQTLKTGRALAADFPSRLEAAGLKVKGR